MNGANLNLKNNLNYFWYFFQFKFYFCNFQKVGFEYSIFNKIAPFHSMFFNECQNKTKNVSSPVKKVSRHYEDATISVSNIAFPLMILNGGERIERWASLGVSRGKKYYGMKTNPIPLSKS